MATAPNDAPIKVKVGLHVHLYLGVAIFILSALPFFIVIFLNGRRRCVVGGRGCCSWGSRVVARRMASDDRALLLNGQAQVLGWDSPDHSVYDVWDWGKCNACRDSLRHSRVGGVARNRNDQLSKAAAELGAVPVPTIDHVFLSASHVSMNNRFERSRARLRWARRGSMIEIKCLRLTLVKPRVAQPHR